MTGHFNKILLVDDDPVFTDVMARGFKRRGFITRTCGDAGLSFGPTFRITSPGEGRSVRKPSRRRFVRSRYSLPSGFRRTR